MIRPSDFEDIAAGLTGTRTPGSHLRSPLDFSVPRGFTPNPKHKKVKEAQRQEEVVGHNFITIPTIPKIQTGYTKRRAAVVLKQISSPCKCFSFLVPTSTSLFFSSSHSPFTLLCHLRIYTPHSLHMIPVEDDRWHIQDRGYCVEAAG